MASVNARIRITRVTNPDELGRQIEPKMRNLTNAIGRRMQRIVAKKSWALHDTIVTGVERDGARVTGTIGAGSAKVDYWDMVERGTSKMKAQPYMRPALLQSKSKDLNYEGTLAQRHGTAAERRDKRNAARRLKYVGSGK
jgi:HK97 gp10 family phage protein